MASSGIDLAALSADQQSTLQQYTAVTNQEIEAAVPLLQRCEWNVQIAIARFFDGEPATDPVAEALANPPQDIRRQETLMNGFSPSSRPLRRDPNLEPAPRIVPQPENQVAYSPNPILALLFTPFSILYSILSKSFRLFGYLFPFLPRLISRISGTGQGTPLRRNAGGRIALKPRDSAARFIREFEEEYGPNELPFFENGYAQALDAAKRELKFLLVILVSPEHDDTASFIRETLLSSSVVTFIKNPESNLLLWMGTVQDAEAYQLSTSINCTKFPSAALICHTPSVSSTSMSIVGKIAGPTPAPTFISRLQRIVEQHRPQLTQTRAQRQEQNSVRSLREQQDSAYERSLAQDRERARQKKEEEERRKHEEEQAQKVEREKALFASNLAQWKTWRAQGIRAEPGNDVKDVVRISLRMLDGERLVRKFAADDGIEELYAFVECYEVLQTSNESKRVNEPKGFKHEYPFRLVSPMPREAFEVEAGGTLKDRIGRSGNLIVEKKIIDDSEDEDEA